MIVPVVVIGMSRQLKHSDIFSIVSLPHYLQILFPRMSEFGIHHSELHAEEGAALTPFCLMVLNRHVMFVKVILFWNEKQQKGRYMKHETNKYLASSDGCN
jgi:hypothetical protein